ncbi:MAG: amino acid kinase family protein [Pseudolabrys sp.]
MRRPDAIIVKLGGSQAGSPHVASWLDALAACAGKAVLVPGGGPFADAVRNAQGAIGFDDLAAHHMALLAMEQFGRALASLHAAFALADSMAAITAAMDAGRVPVWTPFALAARAPDVPASWDVTSDSLAAWLAGKLGARRLLLIKHGALSGPADARSLAARGVVDAMFPQFLEASGAAAAIVAASGHATARAVLRGGGLPGMPIDARAADAALSAP